MLTGETQLRARRTRMKILRAIADRKGAARFSDIRNSTGLSTGSIYYHLERMEDYVGKDSKEYILTDQGFRFLRQLDPSYSDSHLDELPVAPGLTEHKVMAREIDDRRSLKDHIWIIPFGGIVAVIVYVLQVNSNFIMSGLNPDKMIANASLISSISIAAVLSAAFLFVLRRQLIPGGIKGFVFSGLTVLSVIIINLLVFSGLGAQIGVVSSVSYATQLIANASLISSLSITTVLSVAFVIMLRRHLIPSGIKGLTFSALVVFSVIIVNILIFSGLDAQISMNQVVY
jgi:predicted transcriptional regulator